MNDTTSPWRKAQASNSQGACVEVSADGRTLVRDSKDQDGPVLAFPPARLAGIYRHAPGARMKNHVGMSAPDEVETDRSLDAVRFAETQRGRRYVWAGAGGREDLKATLRSLLDALNAWDPGG